VSGAACDDFDMSLILQPFEFPYQVILIAIVEGRRDIFAGGLANMMSNF